MKHSQLECPSLAMYRLMEERSSTGLWELATYGRSEALVAPLDLEPPLRQVGHGRARVAEGGPTGTEASGPSGAGALRAPRRHLRAARLDVKLHEGRVFLVVGNWRKRLVSAPPRSPSSGNTRHGLVLLRRRARRFQNYDRPHHSAGNAPDFVQIGATSGLPATICTQTSALDD